MSLFLVKEVFGIIIRNLNVKRNREYVQTIFFVNRRCLRIAEFEIKRVNCASFISHLNRGSYTSGHFI